MVIVVLLLNVIFWMVPFELRIIISIGISISSTMAIFGFWAWTSHLLSTHILKMLALYFKEWRKLVKATLQNTFLPEDITAKDLTQLESKTLVDHGFALVKALRLADNALGWIIFIEIGVSLLSGAFSIYFFYALYYLVTGSRSLSLHFFISNLIRFIFFTVRVINLTLAGEQIIEEMSYARGTLQRYQYQNFGKLSDKSQLQISILLEKLASTHISPSGCFILGKSSILTALGIFITYTLVLLQFKVGESSANVSANGTNPEIQ